jgi:hypothetical protein
MGRDTWSHPPPEITLQRKLNQRRHFRGYVRLGYYLHFSQSHNNFLMASRIVSVLSLIMARLEFYIFVGHSTLLAPDDRLTKRSLGRKRWLRVTLTGRRRSGDFPQTQLSCAARCGCGLTLNPRQIIGFLPKCQIVAGSPGTCRTRPVLGFRCRHPAEHFDPRHSALSRPRPRFLTMPTAANSYRSSATQLMSICAAREALCGLKNGEQNLLTMR